MVYNINPNSNKPQSGRRPQIAFRQTGMGFKVLGTICLILIGITPYSQFQSQSQSVRSSEPPAQPSSEAQQSQLDKARQANEEAQADYYREQASRLRKEEPKKTLWQNIADNPASALGVLGAVIIALVTLISFLLNYRVSLNNQMDTQFYEALKRFGDKDSPAVRFSAAAILAQMASYGRRTFNLRHPLESLRNSRRIYFVTTRNQLVGGLLLEENTVALLGIRDALNQLVRVEPRQTVEMVFRANQRAGKEAILNLVRFFAVHGAASLSQIDDRQWQHGASITEYDTQVLKHIVQANQGIAERGFTSYSLSYEDIPAEKRGEHRLKVEKALGLTFFRLTLIVNVYSVGFKESPLAEFTQEYWPLFLVKCWLPNTDLQAANFSWALMFGANLRQANLMLANLTGTWLRGADVDEAKLWGARITGRTDLSGTNWWQADYYEKNNGAIDFKLLKELFDRYSSDVPPDVKRLHPSVQEFLAKRSISSSKTLANVGSVDA